jgi:hypothetical protein
MSLAVLLRALTFGKILAEKIGVLRPNRFPEAKLLKKSFGKLPAGALAWIKIHRRKAFALNPFVSLKRHVLAIRFLSDRPEANRRGKPAVGTMNTATGTKRTGFSKPGV